jgi:hypothetical protein
MATLTPQRVVRTGNGTLKSMAAASGGGDVYANTGKEWIEITNGGGAGITVYAALVVDGETIAQGKDFAVGAGETRMIAPMPPNYYNDANGRVSLTYSGVTSVTIGVFYL